MNLFVSAATTKGNIRDENQDVIFSGNQILFDEDSCNLKFDNKKFLRFALADGMGGHIGGKQAATTAIKYIQKSNDDQIGEDILNKINNELWFTNNGKKIKDCMGTTICLITIKNNNIYWCSVGDSSIYIISKDLIKRVNKLDEVLGRDGGRTGIINNCLGATNKLESIKVHGGKEALKNNIYCLCVSDGVTEVLSEEKIHKLVMLEEKNLICKKLIEASIEARSRDNISAIIAKLD